MSKRTILIAIVSVIAVYAIYKLITGSPNGQKDLWVDNKVSASYQKDAIKEPIGEMPSGAEIYIDASGSMKPYFRANGTSMINTISEIVNLNPDGTKIFFLDNKKQYTGLVKDIITDVNNQPNESVTTFHDFFKRAACRIDTVNTLIYLVTDGIMSVDKGETSQALVQLRGKITNALSGHEKLAGAIFRYIGEYKGNYWNSINQKLTPKECPLLKEQIERPYFVIVLGQKEVIRKLQTVPVSQLNNPQTYFMGVHDYKGHGASTLALGDSVKLQDMNSAVSLILDLPPCLANIEPSKVKVMDGNNELPINLTKDGKRLVANIPPEKLPRPDNNGIIKVTFLSKKEIPSDWTSGRNTDDHKKGPDEMRTYHLKYLILGMFNGLEGDHDMLRAEFKFKLQ